MDSTLVSATIGAVATVIGAVIGGIAAQSQVWERLFARSRFPTLAKTRWESRWTETVNGIQCPQKEVFEFTKQKRSRVYGYITMDTLPDLKWKIEGDYNDRFLRLFWHPSTDAHNKFFLDYGCYFFERQGDGTFKGYAVGFDSQSSRVEICEHTLRQLPTAQGS